MTGTPRLAQCPRCQAYVLLAHTAGLAVAVDVGAVDTQRFADAVVRRVGLWWVFSSADGTPGRLQAPVGSPRPSWTAQGAQTGSQRLHAEHSCGALAQDMRPVPVKGADTGPHQASATSGGRAAGSRHLAALAGAGAPTHPSPATSASPRPSEAYGVGPVQPVHRRSIRGMPKPTRREKAVRCYTCNRLIDREMPHFAIEHENYHWANHEECP